MKKKKQKHTLAEEGFDRMTDCDKNSGEYLSFASNGMTDNEKIDDNAYFEDFISEDQTEY